jgi:hypothetical protein
MSRLEQDLIAAGEFGRFPAGKVERYDQLDPEKGVNRPTGTKANKELRDFAVERMQDTGLEVIIDKIGNIHFSEGS